MEEGEASSDSMDSASTSSVEQESGRPLVQVTYLNSYIAQKYETMFKKLVAGIISKEKGNMEVIRAASVNEKPVTIVYHDCFEEDTTADKPAKKSDRVDIRAASLKEKPQDCFEEDTSADKPAKKSDRARQNLYGLNDNFIPDLPSLASDEEGVADDVPETPKPAQSFSRQKECFNCGGSHILAQCTEPMDYAKITAKRQQFMNSSSPMMGSARYHESNGEAEDRIKPDEFPDCKPGHVSDELMAALGITRSDLPPWIPLMRASGYPPGHLRSCIVETSGLDFFTEDSPIDTAAVPKVKYDLSKLPIFPGFTGPHTKEVGKSARVIHHKDRPLDHQSHGTIISFLKDLAVRETVQAQSPSPEAPGQSSSTADDMDMSEDDCVITKIVIGGSEANNSEDDEETDAKVVDSWEEVTVPEADVSESSAEISSEELQNPSEAVHASSLPTVSLSLVQEERFELLESPSAPPVVRRDAALLKTSSVPELGSFSGLGVLPENHKFAEGVAPWPFEEATEGSGRYKAIREALEQTRKRKHSS